MLFQVIYAKMLSLSGINQVASCGGQNIPRVPKQVAASMRTVIPLKFGKR